MKNIHLIPTDKPSRLLKNIQYNTFWLSTEFLHREIKRGVEELEYQNIYITSDEEIKDGDWYIDDIDAVRKSITSDVKYWSVRKDYKKIILTTDQDLIKDGVQAIDDEFLEWFVKNPNCESVEVTKTLQVRHGVTWYDLPNQKEGREFEGIYRKVYKIIIPKEELKQKFDIDTCRYFDIEVGCEKEKCICENIQKEEPKQETLEEAAKNYGKIRNELDYGQLYCNSVDSFKAGAKWQQEQNKKLYNEEEVIKLLKVMRVVCTFGSSEEIEDYINNIKK